MGSSTATRGGAARGDEELRALWRRYQDGRGAAARERLILTYAPLVKFVAGRMRAALPPHVDEADLISYGLVGLIGAVERFDPDRQVRFETFAASRIRGAILDELRAQDWVPRSVRSMAREIERRSSELEHRLRRAPRDDELADALGIEVDDLHEALRQISTSSIVALDETWGADSERESASLIDTIGDERAPDPAAVLDAHETDDALSESIARLSDREKTVTALYYYEGLTLREIGEVLDVTTSRVSQIHTRAVLRLRGAVRGVSDSGARRPRSAA